MFSYRLPHPISWRSTGFLSRRAVTMDVIFSRTVRPILPANVSVRRMHHTCSKASLRRSAPSSRTDARVRRGVQGETPPPDTNSATTTTTSFSRSPRRRLHRRSRRIIVLRCGENSEHCSLFSPRGRGRETGVSCVGRQLAKRALENRGFPRVVVNSSAWKLKIERPPRRRPTRCRHQVISTRGRSEHRPLLAFYFRGSRWIAGG